jgi:hypothetical protein
MGNYRRFFSRQFQKPSTIKLLLTFFRKALGMKTFIDGLLKTVCKKIIHNVTFVDSFGQIVSKCKFADGLDETVCKSKFSNGLETV